MGQKVPRDDHTAAKYHWRAGVDKEDHIIPSEAPRESKVSLKRQLDVPEEVGKHVRRKSARVSS